MSSTINALNLELIPNLPQKPFLVHVAERLWEYPSVVAVWLGGSLASLGRLMRQMQTKNGPSTLGKPTGTMEELLLSRSLDFDYPAEGTARSADQLREGSEPWRVKLTDDGRDTPSNAILARLECLPNRP
jgi:hypothetical protein